MTENSQPGAMGYPPGMPIDRLREEYDQQRSLFNAQPQMVQRFLEAQARQIAEADIERARGSGFTLPDRVVTRIEGQPDAVLVVQGERVQHVGSLRERLTGKDVHALLRQRLAELDQSTDKAISVSSRLVRFAVASHMVYEMLPAGRRVSYVAAEGDDIPSVPISRDAEVESAITASTDAIAEERSLEPGRGDLLVPYVPAARKFYLPQWVAFDDQDRLLVNSISEAQADIKSMQRFLDVLFQGSFPGALHDRG